MIVALSLAAALGLGAAGAAPYAVEEIAGAPDQPRLLLAPRGGNLVTLRISFAAGAFEDDDLHGLTRLTQQALLEANGAIGWRAFALELHAAGARLDVTTEARDCAFTLTADARDFPSLARQLARALFSPRFDPTRLKAARARVGLQRNEEPGLLPLVVSIAGDDTRWVNRPVARPEDLDTLTPERVGRHLGRYFVPANATVVVTGAFRREPTLALLRGFRGGTAAARERLVLQHPFQTRRLFGTELHVMALPIDVGTPARAAAARALRELVDATVWRVFRESGALYAHDVELVRKPWIDVLLVTLPGGATGVDLAARLREALAGLRAGRFEDVDLTRARSTALAGLQEDDADPERLAGVLARGGAAAHGAAVADALRALDRPALLAAADGWLDPGNAAYFYLGLAR